MCLPEKTDRSDPSARSMFGLGALMLLACLAGPALVSVLGSLGIAALAGIGAAIVAVAFCAAVPAVAIAAPDAGGRRSRAGGGARGRSQVDRPDGDRRLDRRGREGRGRFRCSGTHLGVWRGRPPTGRRFERVDEVYIFRVRDGRIGEGWGIEDTRSREWQLGLSL